MDWSTLAATSLACLSAGYAVAAAWLSRRTLAAHPAGNVAPGDPCQRPVSVLKPLCGGEPRLYENLASLCRQQHPAYQLVFGVRAADDPAIAVVERLRADFPDCDIALAVDPCVHGSNLKVSNLINLLPLARHPWLVVADSDIAVAPDYLARVTAPLADAGVGVVTCLYRGRRVGGGLWSRLGVQFIDAWFVPSVRIAHAGGSRRFAFGATLALRREALDAIGSFDVLSNRLADDFWLGELTRRKGLATVLSDVVVSTDVTESHLGALWSHELRWMRTIRSLDPLGFAFIFITFTWPMLALASWLAPTPVVLGAALAGLLARSLLARSVGAMLLAPLRDTLLLAEWAAALSGSYVSWRGQVLPVSERPERARPAGSRTHQHAPAPAGAGNAGMAPHALPLTAKKTDDGESDRQTSISTNEMA
ncbi:bacteriohopanetetrol glucosamine biosynthesis glycosyltransferase HpnI [Cupriavidus basilensis]|uniref:Bacteriohopanetetrol glucosamine biosynthesis glycosyltransferase HpnI n=1 Tax=Cupriavidus basilensis TaxID=68895 RepID=A0ABT6ANF4_9BURK|nr:bacteriohopanetetrol glucosamine biosynthesis glycosyltransferase HpnI [Cupriavidus basilensis]MDF3834107.1 bacteriohopanetetrol glucosamine biosynthesis glycosyltransferase HpnI [Cupriavidus basilensis]